MNCKSQQPRWVKLSMPCSLSSRMQGLSFGSCSQSSSQASLLSLAGRAVLRGGSFFFIDKICIIGGLTWKSWKGTSYLLQRAGRCLESTALNLNSGVCAWVSMVGAIKSELCFSSVCPAGALLWQGCSVWGSVLLQAGAHGLYFSLHVWSLNV